MENKSQQERWPQRHSMPHRVRRHEEKQEGESFEDEGRIRGRVLLCPLDTKTLRHKKIKKEEWFPVKG